MAEQREQPAGRSGATAHRHLPVLELLLRYAG